MKMKKMVGALALTAALAMGTAPAFAAGVSNETNEFDDSEAGSTDIVAQVKKDLNPQIKATVPLQVTVTFGSTGATDITGPTASAYKITNTGNGDIKIQDVELNWTNDFFTSAPIYEQGGAWKDSAGKNITTGNYLMFTYDTGTNKTYLSSDHKGSDTVVDGRYNDTDYVADAKEWTQETVQQNKSVGITLGGKAYFTDTISADNVTDTLCQIKYTIAAA